MQGPSWIALFERIPAKLQDSLALTLATGAEILMQSVLRLESDFAIIRGRMSGSTDAGRVLIVPYDQIVNLAFTKRMLVADVQAVFGNTMETAGANGEALGAEEETAGEAATDDAAEIPSQGVAVEMRTVLNKPPAPGASAAPGKNQPPPPSKSILLARLRARLAEQGK
jgi:hypothetical protein